MTNKSKQNQEKQENTFLNLILNIVLPSLILIWGKKFSDKITFVQDEDKTLLIFLIAIACPIIYGLYDLISRRKWNVFAIIGIISVLITGVVGTMKLSRDWIIVKEAAIPAIFGLVVMGSIFIKKPLVKVLFYNDKLLNLEKIDALVVQHNSKKLLEKAFNKSTWLLVFSFALSSFLNFALASYIFKSPSGTDAFNEELGKMTALSWPVIVLPSLVIMVFVLLSLINGIKKATGVKTMEEILSVNIEKK